MEGIISALLSTPAGSELLNRFHFKIVPMINPDGVARGHYYRNSKGVNLALDWAGPASAEVRAVSQAMKEGMDEGRVRLVVNLHSANSPKGHFFLRMPAGRMEPALEDLQDRIFQVARGAHRQLRDDTTVVLLDDPGIASNYLSREYGVYCLYFESNYNLGADDSVITPESLREVGAALMEVLADVFAQSH
jgi:hypothetical protein